MGAKVVEFTRFEFNWRYLMLLLGAVIVIGFVIALSKQITGFIGGLFGKVKQSATPAQVTEDVVI